MIVDTNTNTVTCMCFLLQVRVVTTIRVVIVMIVNTNTNTVTCMCLLLQVRVVTTVITGSGQDFHAHYKHCQRHNGPED